MFISPRTGLLIVVLLIIVPVFVNMGHIPIIQWDESRLAMNALEMYQNGNWIVTHYNGLPDLWNTKPPLMIWLQVLSMHIFGINEWAIRYPTMMAAFSTCLLLYWFIAYKVKRPFFGVLAVAVLISSEGFMRNHVVRTGDYDTLLVCFMLASCIFMYLFIEEEEHRVRHLYLFFTFLTLAFLTKGIPAVIFLPAILGYAIWRKRALLIIKSIHTYIGGAIFIAVIAAWYMIRERNAPGYIKAVIYNDVTGRYLHTDQNNGNDLGFYFNLMREKVYNFWYVFIVPGIVLGAYHKDDRLRHLSVYASVLAVFHFLVVTKAQTKNEWYDAPTYPFWAIVVAMAVYVIWQLLSNQVATSNVLRKNILPQAFLFMVFLFPYAKVIKYTLRPIRYVDSFDDESMGYYLKRIYHDKAKKADAYITWDHEEANILWYLRVLKREQRPIAWVDFRQLVPGIKVMTHHFGVKKYIEEHYDAELVEKAESVYVYRIDGVKKDDRILRVTEVEQ